jgi:shikimate dehydrogenase
MTENRVGLIGWPIEHSVSPHMHNAAFKALGMTGWLYDLIPVPPGSVGVEVNRVREQGYVGINVTVPHKQTVMELVELDARARAIGAVNTIDFRNNTGTNTDVTGFLDDLAANDVTLDGQNVLVIGAGGAGRAVVYGLATSGANVSLFDISTEQVQNLVRDMCEKAGITSIQTRTIAEAVSDGIALIVNCSPVGMWPKVDASPWPVDVPFPAGVTVYDLVYRPAKTKLMQQAEASGGRAVTGLGMLVRQGAAAFKIWTGVEPPVDVMLAAARDVLLGD